MTEPSLRFTTVSLFGEMPTSRTEYILGLNTRCESRSCNGHSATTLPTQPPTNVQYEYGPLRAYIYNRDLSYRFELEPARGIYTAVRVNENGSPRWLKPRQLEPQNRSGKTLHTHTETMDTGERSEIFGYTARHFIVSSRQMRDSELLSESKSDGWYIDSPAAWLNLHPPPKPGTFFHLFAGTGEIDNYRFTEDGNRETGFVLSITRTYKSSFRDEEQSLRSHESVLRDEVTEFAEVPLEPDLFVPPRDFMRVSQLPDGVRYSLPERMRLSWEMLKDSRSLQSMLS